MNFKLRPAKADDSRAVGGLLHKSFNIDTERDGEIIFLNEFQKNNYLVCEVDGDVIGFVSWTQHHEPKHELAELDRIGVDPDFRGKDLGGRSAGLMLFDSMVADMKKHYLKLGHNLRKVYLLVHANNERARRFYEKCGMHLECIIPNHLYDGVDECIYAKYFHDRKEHELIKVK